MTETVLFNLNDPRLSPDEPWLPELLENVGVRHGLFLPLTVNHDLCYRPHRELGETQVTSASLLIVLLVGTVVGALTGLVIGDAMNPDLLAVLAGFLGSVLAAFARNLIMVRGAGVGPDDSRTPTMVIIYAAIASLAASVGAKEVTDLSQLSSGVWIGTLAGLFSATLLGMMMIVYHTNPGEQPKLRTRR